MNEQPNQPNDTEAKLASAKKLLVACAITIILFSGYAIFRINEFETQEKIASGEYISVDECKQLLISSGAVVEGFPDIPAIDLPTNLTTNLKVNDSWI